MQAFENIFCEEGVYFLWGWGSIIFEILLATQEKFFFGGGMLSNKVIFYHMFLGLDQSDQSCFNAMKNTKKFYGLSRLNVLMSEIN